MDWHAKTEHAVITFFKTNVSQGLSEKEAASRLKEVGPNLLSKQKKISPFFIFLQQFNSLVIAVLLGAVAISFLLGEKVDAIAILSIVILNAVIGFILEYRADRAMQALQAMAAPTAMVIREGHTTLIAASHIVPGDVLLLKSGDLIAADARLIEAASFKTNEASLTGESIPVEKNKQLCSIDTPLADRKNSVFMGTSVANGTAKAIVVATGMKTEMGHIASMLGEATREETPLEKKLNQVARGLLWVCFSIIALIFILGLFRHIPIFKLFMSSVSLAVAAIPEGLPAVVTVALALGVTRMISRSVLVRRLSSVETLGCLQVICTDKTGTLTVGEMTARKLITAEEIYSIHGEGYNVSGHFVLEDHVIDVSKDSVLHAALHAAVACNNASITVHHDATVTVTGEPTEIALLVAAAKAAIWRHTVEPAFSRLKEWPFDSERKRMSVLCKKNSELYLYVKGAPEIILERCTHVLTHKGIKELSENDRARMQQSCKMMASEALRVLALAERRFPLSSKESVDENDENKLTLLGLIGLQDPPHADAKESVQRCKMAGIKPVMITGDHPDTARAIADELGILNSDDEVLTGEELEKMSEQVFLQKVKNTSVYARVTAEHKLKIVRAWKKHHRVVAMTGDGVNDAPALKEASIGIAMGKTGTAVTKEAADMIVLDNNFTSIVAGIEEGRTIYDNISKTLAYLLAGNMGELAVVFVALLMGWPLPLLPIQLLWINLVTDGLPAIALATDRSKLDILKRSPRSPQKPLMDADFFKHVLFVGFLTAMVTLGIFAYFYVRENDLIQAQDAAFSVLVTAELFRAFGARSNTKTLWQCGIFSNMRLFFVVSISFFLQIMIHHVPGLQTIFGIHPVSYTDCLLWIGLGMIPFLILEITKLLRKTTNEKE